MRLKPCCIILLSILWCSLGLAEGFAVYMPLSRAVMVGDHYMGIRLLGSLRLPSISVNGLRLGGLSGLAWDEDEEVLYAVSDNAQVFHLHPLFRDGVLDDMRVLAAYRLQDAKGQPLRSPWGDAEGLTLENSDNGVQGDSRLLVSFETRPRIRRYTPLGKRLGGIPLPAALRGRPYTSSNAALEALTRHHRWGLLTAPERPLRGRPVGQIPIFTMDGRFWLYPLQGVAYSALVAMEALPDGSLLTLERAFVSVLHPLVITLRRTRLTAASRLSVDDVAVFDSSQGWLLDNFEGLTRYRGRGFFMVSDDNRNLLQQTLLVYFEMLEPVE